MILSYSRVSTAEQAADGTTSIGEQQSKIRAVAQLRGADKYDIVEYVDIGVSGAMPLRERPKGGVMMAEAQKGDVIVAAKLDRIFRSASDALVTAEKLQERKVDLVLIDMGVEPVTANGAAKLFFSMLAAFAEFERMRIAERMTDGRRGKRARDGHLGGEAPFGYRVVGSGREAKLEPDEAEQVVIQRAQALYSRQPIGRATKLMNQEGLRSRSGKPFQIIQVRRMLERRELLEQPV